MYQVTNIEPLAFVYDKNNDGGYGGAIAGMGMSDAANVVGYNKLVENTAANDYIAASGYLQYEPIKDLVLKFKASRNIYFGSSRNFTPTYELGVMKVNNRASLYEERTKTMSDLLEFTANWNKTFLQKHSVQALFGMSQEENRYDGINASGKKFENNEMSLLGQAQEDFAIGGTKTRSGLRSVFGRLNYNYLMRYMIMASCRYDGSSRFADGNKWGVFPSVSAGWNIANEPFWGNMIPDFIGYNKAHNNWRDSKPPLAAWGVMNIFEQTGDTLFVKEMFDKLCLFHQWWYKERDHDHNGVCEYGSTDGTLIAAACDLLSA